MTDSRPAQIPGSTHDSPPYKRVRARYASQACTSCRQSKLKCNGQNPCERCSRHRIHCQYAQPRPRETVRSNNGSRTLPAVRTAEDRFAAIEARLDALDGHHQLHGSPSATIQQTATRVAQQQLGTDATIKLGARRLPFVAKPEYERYLKFFFEDINPCHPCVNEVDFRDKAAKLHTGASVGKDSTCFLGLNYIIFACADVLQDAGLAGTGVSTPGWHWYLAAEDLVGKIKISGRSDISLIQFLIYEAFYLMHADKANAAYNTVGLACRRSFQMGLHQGGGNDDYSEHMKQRIFWTVYFIDRRISLSVGRPYGIRDTDINIPEPSYLNDAEVKPLQMLPNADPNNSSIPYLCSAIAFAKFAGEIWDKVFAAGIAQHDAVAIVLLDAKIKHWIDAILPTLPLMGMEAELSRRHRWQYCLVMTRFNHLRLLLQRRRMVSMQFSRQEGATCGELACDIVSRIGCHEEEITQSSSFRFHMAVSLGSALLVLSTILLRDLANVGLESERPTYIAAFQAGLKMLRALSEHLASAQRLMQDLSSVTQAVETRLNAPEPTATDAPANDFDALFPYSEIDFAQQNINWNDPMLSQEPVAFPDNIYGLDLISPGNWEDIFDSSVAGYGAPWI